MNADEIYKKYVLKEQPRPLQGTREDLLILDAVASLPYIVPPNFFNTVKPVIAVNPRRTGRTTRALKSLVEGSVYVVPSAHHAVHIMMMAKNLGKLGLHIVSLNHYLTNHFCTGRRALNGEMVVFDHTIYESDFDRLEYDKLMDTNFRYRLAEYEIYFDENQCKFKPEV